MTGRMIRDRILMARILLTVLAVFLLTDAFPQEAAKKADWLPAGNLFPSLQFDFHEAQTTGALYASWSDDDWADESFANFSAGFRRNLVRLNHLRGRQSEIGLELCIYTQFVFERKEEAFLMNFFNVDFKVGAFYQYRLNKSWSFRARLYHLSTHLGDDYIIANSIDTFPDNRRVYEMVDLSAAWEKGPWMVYGNFGCIVHATYERSPLALQAGAEWSPRMKKNNWVSWLAGMDVRCEQQGNFRPCIHTGAGVVLGRPDRHPVTVMIDYYNGWLPFSLFDEVAVQWVGASMYFDFF